ncbi:hypothetical protein [Ensifer canadensis]
MAFSPNAQTVYADGPAGSPLQPAKSEIRKLLKQYENVIEAFLSNGGLIFASLATLNSSLNYAANSMAWVLGDATVANNGIYRKIGGSGTGSWTRVADLPFSFIIASDVGAGTANAIVATTSIPVSSSALVWTNILEANTSSPVTISFNGGSALTVKTNAGNNVAAGGLVAGMIVIGVVSGSTFRLVSDQASAAIAAAAEAAKVAAEAAAAIAVAAATGINLLTVVDRPALKAVDTALRLTGILAERTREGVFYPRLISGLAPSTAAAMAADTGEYIYVPSTDDPATVWIRQGAELRGFWSNSATPAYVHRLRERVMIGDSAGFDCSTTPDANTGAAWLHEIKPGATHGCGYMESHGRVVSTGANGAQFVGATRITGAAGVEGYGGIFHVRNESTNDRDCWAVYIDAVRGSATAGNMAGLELDIANCSGVSDARYLPHGFEGQTVPTAWSYGLALASGGDVRVNPDALPVSFALGIIRQTVLRFILGLYFAATPWNWTVRVTARPWQWRRNTRSGGISLAASRPTSPALRRRWPAAHEHSSSTAVLNSVATVTTAFTSGHSASRRLRTFLRWWAWLPAAHQLSAPQAPIPI